MSGRTSAPDLSGEAWLNARSTQAVLGAIEGGGYSARVVGGAVRNALIAERVEDIDIATTALPEDVMQLAKAAGLEAVPTGLAHGTVTVIADHHPFEVTTLRTDVESYGRHAKVAFTTDWEADARRRDFTLNALYCDRAGEVSDPLGGLDDLRARRVRFIGDARERIREDFLRILRFFRFTARYARGAPDPAGLAACVAERHGLARLSAERVGQELKRLLVAPRALDAIEAMHEHGLLTAILPAAPRLGILVRLAAVETTVAAAADAMLRLAALGVETVEDADRLADRLRLSVAERGRLRNSCAGAGRLPAAPGGRASRALLYREGAASYRGQIAMAWARRPAEALEIDAWRSALTLPERWQAPHFPLKGADLVQRGMAPGPALGAALKALEDWWVEQDFVPDREALLARLASAPIK